MTNAELIAIDKARDAHNAPAVSGDRTAMVIRIPVLGGKPTYGVNYLRTEEAKVGYAYPLAHGGEATVLAPVQPSVEEIKERVFAATWAYGIGYADAKREDSRTRDFLVIAELPYAKSDRYTYAAPVWKNVYIPKWMRAEVQLRMDAERIALEQTRPQEKTSAASVGE